jgi:hypothetical protein
MKEMVLRQLICFIFVLSGMWAAAQEPAFLGNDSAVINKGIQLDSPRLLLDWGSALPDSSVSRLFRIRRVLKEMTVVEWDSVVFFHVPIDSAIMHYITTTKPKQIKWRGFHSIFLIFNLRDTDRMRVIFNQLFGSPLSSINRRGRFWYTWQNKQFMAFITNRRPPAGVSGQVVAFIGIPHYLP